MISNRRDARLFAVAIGFHGAKQTKLDDLIARFPLRAAR